MIELKQTETFGKWFAQLRDERAVAAISLRLARLGYGHTGDAEPVGKGVSELRIHYGPGYRVYFQRRGETIYLLLCGGDKKSQAPMRRWCSCPTAASRTRQSAALARSAQPTLALDVDERQQRGGEGQRDRHREAVPPRQFGHDREVHAIERGD